MKQQRETIIRNTVYFSWLLIYSEYVQNKLGDVQKNKNIISK